MRFYYWACYLTEYCKPWLFLELSVPPGRRNKSTQLFLLLSLMSSKGEDEIVHKMGPSEITRIEF